MTAQEWLNGRTLEGKEMSSSAVAQLLSRIHTSEPLRSMLSRVGGKEITPEILLQNYEKELPNDLQNHPLLNSIFTNLKIEAATMKSVTPKVCHGDIYQKNWLLSDQNRLYLVDWDSAMLADPAMDLSMLLFQYVQRENWIDWLEYYGVVATNELIERILWYASMNYLTQTKRHHHESRFYEMNKDILKLQTIHSVAPDGRE